MASHTQKYEVTQQVNGEEVKIDFTDFRDLRNNKQYYEFCIGEILIISGKLIITDPFLLYNPHPLEKLVDNGKYKVYLYFIDCSMGYRIAYAMIDFDTKVPDTWECALVNESLLDEQEKVVNGLFPVDAGLLSFSDFHSFERYYDFVRSFTDENPDKNIYDNHFANEFSKNGNIPAGAYKEGDWINYILNPSEQNIIMFTSGLGDGLYPAYWGLNSSGKASKLVVDLLVLARLSKMKNKE
ncbi:MAG TPA: DUF4241 domain-containing protein [Ohtaekwangia sp.]|uniref:DUF4241 domain-containing protein n=1 Tax=Ohtaekwangia sp. TaxID=2066019 RepID=UPI002F94FF17